eukprot:Selendium_serpulae@DN11400_c0_g1_i1.p1
MHICFPPPVSKNWQPVDYPGDTIEADYPTYAAQPYYTATNRRPSTPATGGPPTPRQRFRTSPPPNSTEMSSYRTPHAHGNSAARFGRTREPHELTKVRLRSLEYVWEMEEFSRLRRLARMGALPVDGVKVRSASFGSDASGYWYLEVTPGKLLPGMMDDEESDGGTLIELYMDVSKTAEAMAEFCFSFVDESGRIIEGSQIGTNEFQLFKADDDPGPCHGCRLPAMELDRFVRDSRLILKCDMRVFLGVISNPTHALRAGDAIDDGGPQHLYFRQTLDDEDNSLKQKSNRRWEDGYKRKDDDDRSSPPTPQSTPSRAPYMETPAVPMVQPIQPVYLQQPSYMSPIRRLAAPGAVYSPTPLQAPPGRVRYGGYPYGRRVVSGGYSNGYPGGYYNGGYRVLGGGHSPSYPSYSGYSPYSPSRVVYR